MMTSLGSGPSIYRVRGWLRDLGGRFDYQRRVWLVPDSQAWEARRVIRHGGPVMGSTIEPLLDVDGDWSDDDLRMPAASSAPSKIGPPELVLICRKVLTLIADDLNIGVWNESEADLFEYAAGKLLEGGYDVQGLRSAYDALHKKWKKRLELKQARSLRTLEMGH